VCLWRDVDPPSQELACIAFGRPFSANLGNGIVRQTVVPQIVTGSPGLHRPRCDKRRGARAGNRVHSPRRACNRIADYPAKCSNLAGPRDPGRSVNDA
jgi:hypothetical protein